MVFASPRHVMLLSVAAAVASIVLKTWAWPSPCWRLPAGVSLLATVLNGLVAWVLLKAANRFHSITLRNDDLLLTDPIRFHARRTRVAGSRRFVAFHVRVPGQWSVQQGHDLGDQLEQEISTTLTRPHVLTHLEPIEDLTSLADKTCRWEQG